ncbi:MAG: acyl-CoA synthetase [Microbacteriaceae bacterium]|nr:acyl-CoA synthetase [Microbacteriaceae bacterium]
MTAWDGSVLHRIEHFANTAPDSAAYRQDDEVVTYAQLRERARRAASGMLALGIEEEDRVAIWLPNGLDWIVTGLAAHYAGAIVVPLNTRYTMDEVGYILKRTRARALVASAGFLGRDYLADIQAVRAEFPALEFLIGQIDAEKGGPSLAGLVQRGDADDAAIDARLERIQPDDTSDIMFTSGTTGYPKGAMISHGASVGIVWSGNHCMMIEASDRQLVVTPFFHMFGYKYGWSYTLVLGACVMSEPVFDARRVASVITEHSVTVFSGPPTLFHSLLALPDLDSFDLTSLRFSLTGAANVPPELVHAMKTVLGIDRVGNGYGLTESTATGTFTSPDDGIETVATSPGTPVPGMEMRIIAADGSTCAPDEAGEILLRGFALMKGYFEDPEATAEAIDGNGWLHTGDLASVDSAGRLHMIGRLKEVIIVGGFNVYPAEVERVLGEHPHVSAAAVIGMPDDRLGEVPIAYVEATAQPDEIVAWCAGRLANFKVPRRVVVVQSLPRTALGKIRKVELVDL